jgi:hypothetical protein
MARKEKKYHFIYKTTNQLNGTYYVGMHSTDNLNDGYLGSGLRLRRSIRRNGKENFKLEILEFFSNRTDLSNREAKLVNEDLLKDPLCMNLKQGGFGGFVDDVHRDRFIEASKQNLIKGSTKVKQLHLDKEWVKLFSNNVKLGLQKNNFNHKTFENRIHTTETKVKISETKKGTGVGNANSQFGTMWITNGTDNKKIKKEEIIPNDWKKGRI